MVLWIYEYKYPQIAEESVWSPGARVTGRLPIRVLETELGCSTRVVHALNHWATFLDQLSMFLPVFRPSFIHLFILTWLLAKIFFFGLYEVSLFLCIFFSWELYEKLGLCNFEFIFCASTVLFLVLWVCSIIWNQILWCFDLCDFFVICWLWI